MTEQIHVKEWQNSYLYKTIEGKCRFIKGAVCSFDTAMDVLSDCEYIDGAYNGTASEEGYTVDGVPLNFSDKDQKWLGIKDTFKF